MLSTVGASNAHAAIVIDHRPVKCAVAEKFPKLEARFSPAGSIANARVVFQGANTKEWYSVAMVAEGPSYSAVLPKPKKSLKSFRYYVEATDKAIGTSRTEDYEASVVASASECSGTVMAATVGSASVLLQGAAGAAGLPAGFASTGVVAGSAAGSSAAAGAAAGGGGGGLSGGAIAGIAAGGVAVAGAAVAAGKGGDSDSASTTPTPSPGTTYTGSFSGQRVTTFTNPGPGCISVTTSNTGTLTVTLGGSGSNANSASTNGTRVTTATTGNCGTGAVVGDTNSIAWFLPVTVSGGGISFSGQQQTENLAFTGSLSGGVITGTLTLSHSLATSTGTQSGSVSINVTLR